MPFTVNLNAFDANEKRIYEGGARVKIKAIRQGNVGDTAAAAASAATGPKWEGGKARGGGLIEGAVRDMEDGSYLLTLEVPESGKYTVGVEVNSIHIKDSPFDLIAIAIPTVSAPSKSAFSLGIPLGGSSVKAPAQQEKKKEGEEEEKGKDQQKQAQATSTVSPPRSIQLDSSDLSKVLNVGNIGAGVGIDQLRQLFAFFGRVQDCSFAGSNQFALVRFTTQEECQIAAKSLNGVQVGDKPLRVELAGVPHFMRPPPTPTFSHATGTHTAQQPTAPLPSSNSNNIIPRALQVSTAQRGQGVDHMANTKTQSQIAAERAAAISKRLAAASKNNDDDNGTHREGPDPRGRDRDRSSSRRNRERSYSRSRSSSRSQSRDRSGHRRHRREGRSHREDKYYRRDRDDRDYRRSDSQGRRDHRRYDDKYRSSR
jgi:RNA recognition motif-containing protein